MSYEILPIQEKHIEGFWQALDEVAKERKYIAFLEAPPLDKTSTFVKENIQKKHLQFVALYDDKVIGWCDIVPTDSRPIFKHRGTLGIGIIKSYRGKKIGQALLSLALQKARGLGLTRIELTVREHNLAAINLYKKFGFIKEGIKRKAIFWEGKYEDLICMGLIFEDFITPEAQS